MRYQEAKPWNQFSKIVSIPDSESFPDFCIVTKDEVCAFFEAPASWKGQIMCWAWSDNGNNFSGGTWPGVACTLLGKNMKGNEVWKWTYTGELMTNPTKLIFINGFTQTSDLTFENGGYYSIRGLEGIISSAIHTEKKRCSMPSIYYENGEIRFSSATEGASFVYELTDTDIKRGYGKSIKICATYNISVYATCEGYDNSEIATATLCWIDVSPKTEGITESVTEIRSLPVLIHSNDGVINISGISSGIDIKVFNIAGIMVGSDTSTDTATTIRTNLKKNETVIIKIGGKSIKTVIH